MRDELCLSGTDEPLGLWLGPGAPLPSEPARVGHDFELTSRGDRVTGRVLRAAQRAGREPLVLVAHELGGSAQGVLDALGARLASAGAVVAAIDFPLHGARADQKLLQMLAAPRAGDRHGAALAAEFVRQALCDLERALDALTASAWVDAQRIGFVGFGFGGQLGSAFCALDPRPTAAALAPAVGAALAGGPDPARYLDRIAPRPVLCVDSPPATASAAIGEFLASRLATR